MPAQYVDQRLAMFPAYFAVLVAVPSVNGHRACSNLQAGNRACYRAVPGRVLLGFVEVALLGTNRARRSVSAVLTFHRPTRFLHLAQLAPRPLSVGSIFRRRTAQGIFARQRRP
jgi:hypothetical protein